MLDAPNTEVRNGHCEQYRDCILIGANNPNTSGNLVSGILGSPTSAVNVVEISNNYPITSTPHPVAHVIQNIEKQSGNSVFDGINSVTLSDAFTAVYSYAGIRAGAVATGVGTNTDLAGQCRIGGVPSCNNIPFTQTYTSAPICTCSDTSGTTACRVQVTLGPPTTLTITIPGSSFDTINYICIGRN
jgi:hypothetical protein